MKLATKLTALLISGCLTYTVNAETVVFAAASMTNALEDIKAAYQKDHPQAEIIFSFASSSVLARQITEGAPADIFISADQKWMNFLQEKRQIIPESRTNLVGNKLVMIAPNQSEIKTVDLEQTQWHSHLQNSYLAVGDPDHVPAGIYAKAALNNLNQWHNVEHKLARAKNVRDALRLVEMGESPLGIVYSTDAKVSQKVKVVAQFPDSSHPAIEYPMAKLKNSNDAETQAFFEYLSSAQAKQIFQKFGFSDVTSK